MAEISINGVRRTEFGKGASRRARRDGLVPAVIYGHGEKPQHITLPARELGVALKQSNVLLDIVIDGKTELTLPKAIVRHPLKQILEHVDLVLVRRGEKVVVSVPLCLFNIKVKGIIEGPHDNFDVKFQVRAFDITDGEETPVFSTLEEFQAQNSRVFWYESEIDAMPYSDTIFKDWWTVTKIPKIFLEIN